jgi:hypothetical protein
VCSSDLMLEEVLEKLRKIAIIKYCGQPEDMRDYEVQTHYFLYMFDVKTFEKELEYREVKGRVIEMWFEGTFQMKERITLEEMYSAREAGERAKECDECEEGQSYVPPPDCGKTKAYVS